MLDFYSCADCGRCSDNCPANAVGRPLSPRFISIKCRDYSYKKHPIIGSAADTGPMIGKVLKKDDIWSCTTCGACVRECPVLIEHIDTIVDMRRYLVIEGRVDAELQDALANLGRYGNSFGKSPRMRARWSRPIKPKLKDARKEEVEYL